MVPWEWRPRVRGRGQGAGTPRARTDGLGSSGCPQTCMVLVEQSQVWVGSEDSVIYVISVHSMSCNKQLTDHRTSVTDLVVPDRTEAPRCRALQGAAGTRAGQVPGGGCRSQQRAAGNVESGALRSGPVSGSERHSYPAGPGLGVRRVVSGGWHSAFRGFWWSGCGPRCAKAPASAPFSRGTLSVPVCPSVLGAGGHDCSPLCPPPPGSPTWLQRGHRSSGPVQVDTRG